MWYKQRSYWKRTVKDSEGFSADISTNDLWKLWQNQSVSSTWWSSRFTELTHIRSHAHTLLSWTLWSYKPHLQRTFSNINSNLWFVISPEPLFIWHKYRAKIFCVFTEQLCCNLWIKSHLDAAKEKAVSTVWWTLFCQTAVTPSLSVISHLELICLDKLRVVGSCSASLSTRQMMKEKSDRILCWFLFLRLRGGDESKHTD